ncbi:MAG: SseB family protein [Rhodobacteraceae bacterium]|nr:SseB family protein [Paracoccaceae bacterium]
MAEPTLLDRAHARMQAAPEDDALRLAYYGALAAATLFVIVRDAAADPPEPVVLPLSDGDVVLAFDAEERLAAFTGRPTPHAALAGRILVAALAGRGIGLLLNPGDGPAAFHLPAAAVDWLAATLAAAAAAGEDAPVAGLLPAGPSDLALAAALAPHFADLPPGLATAVLVRAQLADGRAGPVLVLAGAPASARAPLASAAAEAALFAAADEEIGLAFAPAGSPLARQALSTGLVLNPGPSSARPPAGPGTDPARPPRLRLRPGPQ